MLTAAGGCGVILALAFWPGAAEESMPKHRTTANAARVKAAFEAARTGDLQPSAELAQMGKAAGPLVAPYVGDPNEDVRRQAVAVLKTVGGKAALPPLIRALNDAAPDIQEMAAMGIYEGYPPKLVATAAGAGDALRKAARGGTRSPAVPLLLGYFPGAETVMALEELRGRDPQAQVRLRSWSIPVPVSLPVAIALSRLGAGEGRKDLLATIQKNEQGDLEFILEVLRDVDAPEVLHALAGTLDDLRPVDHRVPTGVEPRPRLCDVAAGAFVTRLKLKAGFKVNPAIQYSPAQIDEVRKAIRAAIPQ